MNIKSVIFDLDNTLYDENMLISAVCKEFSHRYDLPLENVTHILDDEFRLHSKDIFGDWLKKIDFYTADRQEELFALYQNIDTTLSLYDDVKGFLTFLEAQNVAIGILTNGNLKAQQHKIGLLSLSKYQVEYARSNGIQYEKPHINAFERILSRLNTEAQDCIFVGDNPLTDIVGANNAKIFSVWFHRGYGRLIPCDYAKMKITHFDELRRLWQ